MRQLGRVGRSRGTSFNVREFFRGLTMLRWSWRYWAALSLAMVGFLLLAIFSLHPAFNDRSGHLSSTLASEYGQFTGGLITSLFSLAGVFLLFETLIRQQVLFDKQQTEMRFFELLKLHRENVAEMQHKVPYELDVTERGRRVFLAIRSQLGNILDIIRQKCQPQFSEPEIIDISYLILFFGLGQESRGMLDCKLQKYDDRKVHLKEVLDSLAKVRSKDGKTAFFGGHQSRLGHYYRHFYQTVKYIDSSGVLSAQEKYKYIKMLRAQLSTEELVVFFFNSLSQLGKPWQAKLGKSEENLMLRYKLIKNIPEGYTFSVKPKSYYDLTFEYEGTP
jgi:hypothetical protein